MPLGQVLASFDGLELPDLAANRQLIGGSRAELVDSAGTMARVMGQRGLLLRPVDTGTLFDDTLLEQLQ